MANCFKGPSRHSCKNSQLWSFSMTAELICGEGKGCGGKRKSDINAICGKARN